MVQNSLSGGLFGAWVCNLLRLPPIFPWPIGGVLNPFLMLQQRRYEHLADMAYHLNMISNFTIDAGWLGLLFMAPLMRSYSYLRIGFGTMKKSNSPQK